MLKKGAVATSDSGNDSTDEGGGGGEPQRSTPMSVSSDEVNFLVYRYLQESGTCTTYQTLRGAAPP
jgi:hypothetical protein